MRYFFVILLLSFVLSCKEEANKIDPVLSVSVQGITVKGSEQTSTFEIKSNGSWNIVTTSEWVMFSSLTGTGDAIIKVNFEVNPKRIAREGVIVVSQDNLSERIQLNQEGNPNQPFISDPFVFEMPADESEMRPVTSLELSKEMGIGWNIGNSLDAVGGETHWGNPQISKRLIDSVKHAGFNSVRIPVAWSKFSNERDYIIEDYFMLRVETVVNYVLDNEMYAIINIHWDEGWMQPTYDDEYAVNYRLNAMWKQIASHFRDYDDHLLFAGTNEVLVTGEYGTPLEENYTVQNGFNQNFVTTVRNTGGRNVFRHLIVQGYNTNIDHTINFARIPKDTVEDRLFMEVHYYDPYNFTLNEDSEIHQWGEISEDPQSTENWANEVWVDAQFEKMQTNFINEGVPVILGEYGVIKREEVTDHDIYRKYYLEYVTNSAVEHELVPFYWDNGYDGNYGFALFDRETGDIIEPELIEVIID